MIIEKLKKEDLSSYKELIDECFESSNDFSYYENNYDEESQSYEIMIAKENERIIGAITIVKINLFTFPFHPMLELFNVAVLKEYRGKKVAKKLMEKIVDYAKEKGYKSIVLTCLDTAIDAHRFYESVGFVRTSSVKYNLKLD